MHQRAVLATADEIEDDPDQRIPRILTLDPRKPLTEDTGTQKQSLVGGAQTANVVTRKTAPTQTDHVESVEHSALTNRQAERDDVGTDPAHAGHHGALTDAHELVDGGCAAKDDPIAHCDVTAKHGVIGHDHVVADVTIMADMGADHEEAAVADAREPAAVLGPEVHGDVFADVAVGADLEPRRSAAIADRLRRCAERRERIDLGARSDAGVAGHMHM